MPFFQHLSLIKSSSLGRTILTWVVLQNNLLTFVVKDSVLFSRTNNSKFAFCKSSSYRDLACSCRWSPWLGSKATQKLSRDVRGQNWTLVASCHSDVGLLVTMRERKFASSRRRPETLAFHNAIQLHQRFWWRMRRTCFEYSVLSKKILLKWSFCWFTDQVLFVRPFCPYSKWPTCSIYLLLHVIQRSV